MLHRFLTVLGAVVVIALSAGASLASANVVHVTTLPSADVSLANYADCDTPGGNFTKLLSHGLHIGDFDNSGLNVGGVNLDTNPAIGRRLADLTQLDYDGRALPSTTAGWSFLQIYLDNGQAITYSPNTQPGGSQVTGSGDWRNWDVVNGTARYNDAIGNFNDVPFTDIQAARGNLRITGISVYGGPCSGSSSEVDLDAMHVAVRAEQQIEVYEASEESGLVTSAPAANVTYDFGLANTGPQGPNGATGTTGSTGARGPQGGPAPQGCTVSGAGKRTLHAYSARRGERFVSARAWLRTAKGLKKLSVKGRTITVNLPVVPANYNVKVNASYRKTSGKVVTRTTERNISVVCS